tara:strand:- start:21806 stop:22126 length:321 start_codon:yes stop_codon:yes gene_type:complete
MSIVGSIHIQCGASRCGRHVFAVDADEYISDMLDAQRESIRTQAGIWSHPKRYCPRCEAAADALGYESERAMDERIAKAKAESEAQELHNLPRTAGLTAGFEGGEA